MVPFNIECKVENNAVKGIFLNWILILMRLRIDFHEFYHDQWYQKPYPSPLSSSHTQLGQIMKLHINKPCKLNFGPWIELLFDKFHNYSFEHHLYHMFFDDINNFTLIYFMRIICVTINIPRYIGRGKREMPLTINHLDSKLGLVITCDKKIYNNHC